MADLSNIKVLVADDEPRVRALVADSVRALGCAVVEAADGDEAWQRAQTQHVDIVVLDVMMPGMSGWEVCKRVKTAGRDEDAAGPGPKILMLTGIGERLNEMTSPLFAADDWIDKPFDLAVLLEKIKRLAGLEREPTPGATAVDAVPVAAPDPAGDVSSARAVKPPEPVQAIPAPEPCTCSVPAPPCEPAPAKAMAAFDAASSAPAELAGVAEPPVPRASRKAKKAAPKKATEAAPKKAAAKKPAKKAAPSKAKKAAPKKVATKKAAPKKAAAKKPAKKAVPRKTKKVAPKKVATKKAAPKKAAAKRLAKKAAPSKAKKPSRKR